MSLTSLFSNLLCGWFAFLIPCYSTWKALSHRPVSEPELERWGMYWVCVGGLVAVESAAGWLLSWLPFYWETRTLFLLFLALPQTQGSTFIFKSYVEPFFKRNEGEIDAGLLAAQTNIVTFAQGKLTAAWESLWQIATRSANMAGASGTSHNPQYPNGQAQPSTAPSPASVFAMGANLFQTYGTGAMGALQRSMGSQSQTSGAGAQPPQRPSPGYQPRPPIYAPSSAASSRSGHSSHSNTPPAYPEPYHF